MGNVRELRGKIKIAGAVKADEPMSGHTSFHIGGPADLYAAPESEAELAYLRALCAHESVPFFLLGGGSNILVSDLGIRGLVIDLGRLSRIERDGCFLRALCGTPMSGVSEAALSHGLTGLEFCYALPGSVGGAVWMNARCYEKSISDVLARVEVSDADGAAEERDIIAAQWGYKRSPFQTGGDVILRASFRLAPGTPREIEDKMRGYRLDREKKGHFLHPCAGSVFKNNRVFGAPTGKLIDSQGLKGTRKGNAQIAPFHGNIIVNLGGAAAADVLALIELIERETLERLGFRLEREVLLVGEW